MGALALLALGPSLQPSEAGRVVQAEGAEGLGPPAHKDTARVGLGSHPLGVFRGPPRSRAGAGGLLFLTGCFLDNGHLYREDQPSPAPGLRCLNWLDAQVGPASALKLGECSRGAAGGGWQAGGGGPGPSPDLRLFSPQALATTTTVGIPTATRAGPGATSAARPAPPRRCLVRTRVVQVPVQDPGPLCPGLTGSGGDTLSARAAARGGRLSLRPRPI